MKVAYDMAAPKTGEDFLAIFQAVVKHFPPTPEQLAAAERRERNSLMVSTAPSPAAVRHAVKRGRRT